MIARVLLALTALAVLAWAVLAGVLWLLEHVLVEVLARAVHLVDVVVCVLAALTLAAWLFEIGIKRAERGP
jgi:hypothetical protein